MANNYAAIFHQYRIISRVNSGWSLTELRRMPVRERHYWFQQALAVRKATVET